MSKSRKKIFPKKPIQFHSKLEPELGRHSNKVEFFVTYKGIYSQPDRVFSLGDKQQKQVDAIRYFMETGKIKG